MNIKKAEDVVYVYDEIKWLKNVIDNLLDSGVHTSDELIYRKEAVKWLSKVLEVRVKQLEEF